MLFVHISAWAYHTCAVTFMISGTKTSIEKFATFDMLHNMFINVTVTFLSFGREFHAPTWLRLKIDRYNSSINRRLCSFEVPK